MLQARIKSDRRETRTAAREAAAGWRERRERDLKQTGVVIPLSEWLGHNNGPPMLESQMLLERQWRKAQEAAFAPPDLETGRRWAKKAEAAGMTYREYRLELLERGRYPREGEDSGIRGTGTNCHPLTVE
jgi:hypothetical protein